MNQIQRYVENAFFFILLVGVLFLLYMIFSPYLSALFFALVLSIMFEGMHRRFLGMVGGRKGFAALVSVIVVMVTILLPLSIVAVLLFGEAVSLYNSVSTGGGVFHFIDTQINVLEGYIQHIAPSISFDFNIQTYAQQVLHWAVENINSFFASIVTFILNVFIMVLATYFLFKDGPRFRKQIVELSPFSDEYDERILQRLTVAINSGLKGTLAIAILQGFLTGLGFAIFGIPNPVLWGFLATFTALIPTLGTGIITVPAGAFLIFTGSVASGVGLLVWGLVIVGLIDNMVRPMLIERGMKIHSFIILISILGSLPFFGPIGVLAGPVVVAFLFALLDVYPHIIHNEKISADTPSSEPLL